VLLQSHSPASRLTLGAHSVSWRPIIVLSAYYQM
jgi:hypothetical protein